MNTIPNLAPTMTAHVLTLDEFKKYADEDRYYWIDLNPKTFGLDGRDVYNLRLHVIWHDSVDFATPFSLLALDYDTYGTDWKVWNLCPTCEDLDREEW